MHIKNLYLKNFRNYGEERFEFSPALNVLFGKNGYLVCEVNANAFFGAFEKATGINVARAYAEHILAALRGA